MNSVYVESISFWSPGFACLDDFVSRPFDKNIVMPVCSSVNRRFLRYTSLITRMSLSVFEQALVQREQWKKTVGVVFASSMGEIQIATKILKGIEQEGAPSPATFMNSVHNSAIGHLSIACKNQMVSTAIAAGRETVSAAITEAILLLQSTCKQVAIIVADEALPTELGLLYPSLAACVLLTREKTPRTCAMLSKLALSPGTAFREEARVAGNPVAPLVPLLVAMKLQQSGRFRLGTKNSEGWSVDMVALADG